MKTEKIVKTSYKYILDKQGEYKDGEWAVGDEIIGKIMKANGDLFGIVRGKITEIYIHGQIYQLKVNDGWCVHPYRGDEVTITKKVEPRIDVNDFVK